MQVSKEATGALNRFNKLTAERADIERGLVTAQREEEAAAQELELARSHQASGGLTSAASREKLKRATDKFAYAEQRVAPIKDSLMRVQAEIRALHSRLQTGVDASLSAAWEEFKQQYGDGAAAFVAGIVRRVLAFRELGRPVPFEIEQNLCIPPLDRPNGHLASNKQIVPLIPTRWDESLHMHVPEPVWDETAQAWIDQIQPLRAALKSVTAEVQAYQAEQQNMALAARAVEKKADESNPWRNAAQIQPAYH